MLTIKKQACGIAALAVGAAACFLLTGCGPPGSRALHRGDELIKQGQYEEAIAALRDAVELLAHNPPPVQAQAWNFLGLAYHGAGQVVEARKSYAQALKLDRNLAAADFNLGCLELEQKHYPQAIDLFTTYITLRPRDVVGYVKLGSARLRFGLQNSSVLEKRRQLDEAKRNYDIAQSLALTAEACNALGVIELERKSPPTQAAVKSAAKDFETALQYDRKFAPAILNQGIIYDQYLNDRKTALARYNEYLLLETNAPNSKQVERLARQVYEELRITVVPMNRVPPLPVPGGGPKSALPIPTRPKVGWAPLSTPPTVLPETSRIASHDSPTASTSARPVETAQPAGQTPSAQTATSPGNTAPDSATNVVLLASKEPSNEPNAVADVHSPKPLPARKVGFVRNFFRHLNPLNWFSGKFKDFPDESVPASGAAASPSTSVPPLRVAETTSHYLPPEPALIKGDRAEAMRLVGQANLALRESRASDAMRTYRDAVKADPTCYDACFSLGLAAIDAKDFSTALEALHQALLIQEDSADARYAYAWSLEKKHYYQDAADQLEQLLAQHGEEVRGHLLLGNLYAQQLDRPKLARQHYATVLGLDPHNSQAPALRSWLQDNASP
jgi:tetratricopeptide (TPR) repeat protein